jgi:hypothetical protein
MRSGLSGVRAAPIEGLPADIAAILRGQSAARAGARRADIGLE